LLVFPLSFLMAAVASQDRYCLYSRGAYHIIGVVGLGEAHSIQGRKREIQGGRQMIIVTSEQIEGKEITETLGLVKGSTIRARNVGHDIMAGLRNIVGGEVKDYTVMLAQAREEALQRMIEQAEKMGTNAVICTRFATSMVMSGAAEMVAYGIAVKVA
jgi:uncharacterized protein YbjQ (UPF0145 family)